MSFRVSNKLVVYYQMVYVSTSNSMITSQPSLVSLSQPSITEVSLITEVSICEAAFELELGNS